MLKTTTLAALTLVAFSGFASAGILDAYDPYANGPRGTYQSRSVDRTPTSSISGETEMMSGFSFLGRGQVGRTVRPLDDHEGNCCGSSR